MSLRRSTGGRGRRRLTIEGGQSLPLISGDKFVGGTLTASGGAGAPFQWKRDGIDIPGETGPTYVIVDADEGTDTTAEDSSGGVSLPRIHPTIPAGLICALELWDATPDANGELDTCPDRSGNGNTGATAAALAARPVLAPDAAFNGQVVGAMAGLTGHYLRVATWAGTDPIPQPYEVHYVGAQPNVGGVRQQWDSGGNGTHRSIGYKLPAGFAVASISNLTGGSTETGPTIYGGLHNGVASALFESDPATPVAVGNAGTRSLSGITAAGSRTGLPYSQTLAAIFVFPDEMSETERRALYAYCYWRWRVGIEP